MTRFILFIWVALFSVSLFADKDILTVDSTVGVQAKFPNDKNIHPGKSQFEILNYVLMSSEEGERWAVVTLKNTSTGSRIFDHSKIMALFANGVRQSPLEHKQTFEGGEEVSITLPFGRSKFPILEVFTNN